MPDKPQKPTVTAIILAAGLSTRMGGHPKPLLPFGDGTVIEHILTVLTQCPIGETIVVTGHGHQEVERHLARWSVHTVFNSQYAFGEMLSSIQTGLRSASTGSEAALITLGDQPALSGAVVEAIIDRYREEGGGIVVPSFQKRRGHPILIGRPHWSAILELKEGQTLRVYMHGLGGEIRHVETDAPGILRDMDTPEEYRQELAEYLNRQTDEARALERVRKLKERCTAALAKGSRSSK